MTLVERLGKVFQAAFGFDAAKFSAEIVPQDVSKWDSIGHMTLVAELEKEFQTQLEIEEIMEMSSAAVILDVLKRKGVKE